MFNNVSINDVKFIVANVTVVDGGFKVVGITDTNEAKELVVKFCSNFSVVCEFTKEKPKTQKPKNEEVIVTNTTTATLEAAKVGGGHPKIGDEPIVAAEKEYFSGEDVITVKRGRGRPRKNTQ